MMAIAEYRKKISVIVGEERSLRSIMGMTIDEIISILDDMKVKIDIPKAAVMQNNKNYALDMAKDTMRKYQKIVDIVSLNAEEFKQCGLKGLKEILEVIADGK